ncbi:hypothetical protein M409DRAFT_57936 [Zasmidium cellare ATCC 36951]|uniref:Uncharacterized protein n=1 Tax=Zasmidium cellare ATCC 36951 TaxID=1080233 RepID=A0A6A6C6Y4_ZASCE|nr:uncharacterized protein M409DRAFT_57936 [Zasmidium cellare ATCC 36951]KAF2162884.1 hypothetical protein M409DRAFT_57936 [Zasmidium cellare ATCC 36951]
MPAFARGGSGGRVVTSRSGNSTTYARREPLRRRSVTPFASDKASRTCADLSRTCLGQDLRPSTDLPASTGLNRQSERHSLHPRTDMHPPQDQTPPGSLDPSHGQMPFYGVFAPPPEPQNLTVDAQGGQSAPDIQQQQVDDAARQRQQTDTATRPWTPDDWLLRDPLFKPQSPPLGQQFPHVRKPSLLNRSLGSNDLLGMASSWLDPEESTPHGPSGDSTSAATPGRPLIPRPTQPAMTGAGGLNTGSTPFGFAPESHPFTFRPTGDTQANVGGQDPPASFPQLPAQGEQLPSPTATQQVSEELPPTSAQSGTATSQTDPAPSSSAATGMAPPPASGPLPTRNEPLRVAVHSPARIANSALDEKAKKMVNKISTGQLESCYRKFKNNQPPECCLLITVVDSKPPSYSRFIDTYTKCPKCKGLGRLPSK